MKALLLQLQQENAKVNIMIITVLETRWYISLFYSGDDYRTGCRNVSHCQQHHSPIEDYVHTDDQTQPTFEIERMSIKFA